METQTQRKIIHVDMDAFYVSVEMRDNPALKGLPVVVGGSPQSRGVVAAASYEARRFGIHSAMPCSRAARLCPDLVFLAPDFNKYCAVSSQIQAIFRRYTDLVEPLSLDEAYLDVTRNHMGNPSATWIAREIRESIRTSTGLTASAGVAPNKFLAKVASEQNKPDGLFVIPPENVAEFVRGLPLASVPGIGRATQEKLSTLGLKTCGDMQALQAGELEFHFGKRGLWFHQVCRGIDDRPVVSERVKKSVSVEDTFSRDLDEPSQVREKLAELCRNLSVRLRKSGVRGRTITLKLRRPDFLTITRSRTISIYIDDAETLYAETLRLFQLSGMKGEKLRLLGVGLSNLDNDIQGPSGNQLCFPWGLPA
ncbi:MAG: DNA polymerase IV [Deltaproteobacteria bacterium]|nr:DNA polymerase IV [Deltaproteobacteria bacterium]